MYIWIIEREEFIFVCTEHYREEINISFFGPNYLVFGCCFAHLDVIDYD